jgi:hypothetical protein
MNCRSHDTNELEHRGTVASWANPAIHRPARKLFDRNLDHHECHTNQSLSGPKGSFRLGVSGESW